MSMLGISGRKVWVTGHHGMVGSSLVRRFSEENCRVVTCEKSDCDLREPAQVRRWLARNKPDIVVNAAAKVGGILANSSYPADFIYDNLAIAANLVHECHLADVERLVFLGSSCIYPKFAPQPIPEAALLTGPLEPTNEWYAVAKIAGIKLCQAYRQQHGRQYISLMPTNLYGPSDNYDLQTSHVLPALLRKFHEAKVGGQDSVVVWGTGAPMREFMHVSDLADAVVFLTATYFDYDHINVGSGEEISIRDLALLVKQVVGFEGDVVFDTTKPDGTPRKLMDSSRLLALGWRPKINLGDGVHEAYGSFLAAIGQTPARVPMAVKRRRRGVAFRGSAMPAQADRTALAARSGTSAAE